jgi:hypothetical protein
MSVTKRISGNYTIINRDPVLPALGNVTISTNTFYVDGNLVVGGNATQVTRSDTALTDNTIVLNKGETGAGVTLGTSGIEIDRGTSANVRLQFNESKHYWELTNDGSTFQQVSSGVGTALANIAGDTNPTLGANLNLSGRTIYDSTKGNVSANIGTVGAGGTGVYSNTYLGNHELIQKRLALIYNNLL